MSESLGDDGGRPGYDAVTQARLVAGLSAFAAGLGPNLRSHFDALADRQKIFRSVWPTFFFHPRGLPVVSLPGWCARIEGEGEATPDVVMAAAEAAAAGYLHVRLQDDFMDEGLGDPGPTMLLAEALMVRHQRLLVQVVGGDAGFWALFEQTWLTYGEAMLREAELFSAHGVTSRAEFDAVLGRSRPLLLPPAAILVHRGLQALVEPLTTFVVQLVAAHQLYVDLLDAEADLAAGNHTLVVSRYRGDGTLDSLRRGLLVGGGLQEVVAWIDEALRRAEEAADSMGMYDAIPMVERRRCAVEALARGVEASAFKALLEGLSSSL